MPAPESATLAWQALPPHEWRTVEVTTFEPALCASISSATLSYHLTVLDSDAEKAIVRWRLFLRPGAARTAEQLLPFLDERRTSLFLAHGHAPGSGNGREHGGGSGAVGKAYDCQHATEHGRSEPEVRDGGCFLSGYISLPTSATGLRSPQECGHQHFLVACVSHLAPGRHSLHVHIQLDAKSPSPTHRKRRRSRHSPKPSQTTFFFSVRKNATYSPSSAILALEDDLELEEEAVHLDDDDDDSFKAADVRPSKSSNLFCVLPPVLALTPTVSRVSLTTTPTGELVLEKGNSETSKSKLSARRLNPSGWRKKMVPI